MPIYSAVFAFALLLFSGSVHAADRPLHVVASFSILADMAKTIGGSDVVVASLVGRNADAHNYQPTPDDARALADADLIIVNGLGFEGWMQRLIAASGTHAPVVVASDGLGNRVMTSLKGVPDPHAWQNLRNGQVYARNIAAALQLAMPDRAAMIKSRATIYNSQLDQLDRFLRADFARIPAERRKAIISHDSFSYFGGAYGITFLSPVGIDSEAEPSAADVARLIRQIKAEGIHQVFLENFTNPKLIEQIAADSGAHIGGTLYTDALSAENGPAPTYLAMFRSNADLLKRAMEQNRP